MNYSSEVSVELIDHMGSDASVLAAMLVSTNKHEDVMDMGTDSAYGRINFLMRERHGSPFEHGSMTFRVEAPIFVFREWHRHRAGWSYNEMSGRYTELLPKFYIPAPDRAVVQVGKPGAYRFVQGDKLQYLMMLEAMQDTYQKAWDEYQAMLRAGIAKEVARMVLPVGTFSKMYATCNPRSLMHFLSLRTTSDNSKFPSYPMWEIELCATQMELHFANLFPITYQTFIDNGRVAP